MAMMYEEGRGGRLIAIGLFTVWAALLASGTMAVGYVQFHWKFAFGAEFFPAINRGELAVVYCLLFLYIACRGAGLASLRNALARGLPESSRPANSTTVMPSVS